MLFKINKIKKLNKNRIFNLQDYSIKAKLKIKLQILNFKILKQKFKINRLINKLIIKLIIKFLIYKHKKFRQQKIKTKLKVFKIYKIQKYLQTIHFKTQI